MTRNMIAFLIVLLSLNIALSPETVAVLPEVNNATMMDISGGEMFIIDDVEVKVYSLKDYRFLRKFGKRGEGPGEMVTFPDTPFTMIVKQDKVILNSVYKAIVYEKSGKMILEAKFSEMLIEAVPVGDNYITTRFEWVEETRTARASTFICNAEFKEIKKIYETDLLQSYKTRKFAMPPLGTFVRCAGDRVFLFDQQKDTIKVFDPQGNPKPDITFKCERTKTDDTFKKRVSETLNTHPVLRNTDPRLKRMFYTPDVLPVFRDCRVIADRLYIQTYRQKGEKSEFIIMDFAGNVEKTLYLPVNDRIQIRYNPGSTYAFCDSKYYYLVENIDNEEWELHVQELD